MTQQEYSLAFDNGYRRTVCFLLSRGSTGDTAEEAAQAAWAKGWECRESLRKPNRVVSWVNTIALNLLRNGLRARTFLTPLTDVPMTPDASPRSIDLSRALQKTDAKDRDLFVQHYLEGYTSEELADMMGCTAVAIRGRLLRARRKLHKRLNTKR